MVKRRTVTRILSFSLAALLVMGVFTYRACRESREQKRMLEAGWRRSFAALASDVDQIDTALQKCLYSSSPMLVGSACAEISARAQEAQLNMGELPFSGLLLEKTSGFLGRLGDYSRVLAQGAYASVPGDPDRENLRALAEAAGSLDRSLTELQSQLEQGMVSIHQLAADRELVEDQIPDLSGGLQEIEDQFPELPSLIYDGPYSESVDQGRAKALEGLGEVTEKEAVWSAVAFAGIAQTGIRSLGKSEGRLPCWLLTGSRDGQELTFRVTVQGGRVLDMVASGETGEAVLTPEEAREKAAEFLRDRGFPAMQESYWRREGNTLLVNFAALQGETVCYPDLVKVRVELEKGNVVGFDAEGYLLNHVRRSLPEPVSREQAASRVAGGLEVLSDRLAVIPTEGRGERFCREFLCETDGGRKCLVYVDAETGEEAKVLLLLEDEDGTLTV
jgi:germination protein YpeB